MFSLILSTLKEKRMTILYYCLAGLAVLFLYVSIFPTLKTEADSLNNLLKSYPPALLKAFNLQGSAFSNLGMYLSTEDYGLMWPIILLFFTTSLPSSLLAGEIESGTMGLLLAQPLSRAAIYYAKYFAVTCALIVFIILSILALSPVASLFSLSIDFIRVLELSGIGLLFGLATMSLAFFFSSLFSEKGKVNAVLGGIFALMYVLNIVSSLKDNLSDLKYASFFYYFNSSNALSNGHLTTASVCVFLGVAVVFFTAGLLIFKKRDIPV